MAGGDRHHAAEYRSLWSRDRAGGDRAAARRRCLCAAAGPSNRSRQKWTHGDVWQPRRRCRRREIVRVLGGYTLAIELAGAYLNAEPDFPPSSYLHQVLIAEGPAATERLGDEPGVKKVIRYKDAQQQIIRLSEVLGRTLASLTPPARTALEFASLLQPDAIPLHWLETLTRQRHPEALADDPKKPPAWPKVWRELHGLRLLNPAIDSKADTRLPTVVRIHRLIADHVIKALPDFGNIHLGEWDEFLTDLAIQFQQHVGHGDDASLRAEHPWLRDQAFHLLDRRPSPTMLKAVGVASEYEQEHGQLSRALTLSLKRMKLTQHASAAHPADENLRRDVSTSMNMLGDALCKCRGEGDAAQAIVYYQESLETLRGIQQANPLLAQAARDLSVSLNNLGDAIRDLGGEGDAPQVIACYQESLEIRRDIQQANPLSAKAARDVSVSMNMLGDALRKRSRRGRCGPGDRVLPGIAGDSAWHPAGQPALGQGSPRSLVLTDQLGRCDLATRWRGRRDSGIRVLSGVAEPPPWHPAGQPSLGTGRPRCLAFAPTNC